MLMCVILHYQCLKKGKLVDVWQFILYVVVCVLQPVTLVLLDIEAMMGVLKGVVMEMTDCALPLLKG